MLGDIKYQPIAITINAAGSSVTVEADTDKLYARCTGIYVSLPEAVGGTEVSTLSRTEINGKELFPEGYEVKMLSTTRDTPPDERFYELDEPAKGARFKTKFNDASQADLYPYSVVIYLRLENE